MGINTQTSLELTEKNRRNFLKQCNLDADSLAYLKQVHGNSIIYAEQAGFAGEADGLVTDRKGVTLGIMVADCAAVLLADPKSGVIGAFHAGWKGAAGNIVPKGIAMMRSLGAQKLQAWISPCIGTHAFEVGIEVAEQFPSSYVINDTYEKPRVDMQAFITSQLINNGVKSSRIECDERCTFTDIRFFSYRRQGVHSGRMMAIIALKA